MTVVIEVNPETNMVTNFSIVNYGVGYEVGDVVTIAEFNSDATFTIDTLISDDFTNVGATLNQQGEVFIATGTTPTSYLAGSTITLTSINTKSELDGEVSLSAFSYVSPGVYSITSDGLFIEDKTHINIGSVSGTSIIKAYWVDINTIHVSTMLNGSPANGVLLNTPIEIRVYD
jgi:hypothetical protein